MTTHSRFRPLALAMSSALLLGLSSVAAAQEAPRGPAAAPAVTPRAQAVLDRMTNYLRSLQAFSISADSSRDKISLISRISGRKNPAHPRQDLLFSPVRMLCP